MGQFFSSSSVEAAALAEALGQEGYDESSSKWAALLQRCDKALAEMEAYPSHQEHHQAAIRDAMAKSDDVEAQDAALRVLAPAVGHFLEWFRLADDLAQEFSNIIVGFDAERAALPKKGSPDHQSPEPRPLHATRALARSLVFALTFDTLKMCCANVQNDFSFVRRSANKAPASVAQIIDVDMIQRTQLFLAEASPFIGKFSGSLAGNFIGLKSLGQFGALACAILSSSKDLPADRVKSAVKVMVAALVVYDKASKKPGAFGTSSPISAKKVALAIKKRAGDEAVQLFSTMRYGTANYDSASTAVQNIVEE